MTEKDAHAIAVLMRRQHGAYASAFVASQIRHFEREISGGAAVEAWRAVAEMLSRSPARLSPGIARQVSRSDHAA
jgi:hypothetical protein